MVEKSEKDQTNYYLRNILGEFSAGDKFSLYKGTKRYELTNHLGNVLSVVSDELTPNGEAQVISAKDYYPFGMSMPSRTTEGGTYRYGFNGQERDTELGESVYTAEFWQYSANLGRRWNIDPVVLPWESPYATFNNNPILLADPSGASATDPVKETEPNYDPSKDKSLLAQVTVTAKRPEWQPTNYHEQKIAYREQVKYDFANDRRQQGWYGQSPPERYMENLADAKLQSYYRQKWIDSKFGAGALEHWMPVWASAKQAYYMAQIDDIDYKGGAVFYGVLAITDVVAIEGVVKTVARRTMVATTTKITRYCFVAGTTILTSKGLIAIEDLVVGDTVLSYSEEKRINEWKRVVTTFRNETHKLTRIVVGKDTILATPSHRFFTNKGWVHAKDLDATISIKLTSDSFALINFVTTFDTIAKVYNIEVADNHNYFITGQGLLVHNHGCIDDFLAMPKSIWGKSAEDIAQMFIDAGYEAIVEQSKKGSQLSKQVRIKGHNINNVQVHPGGGTHGGAYYKISTSNQGVIKVAEKATYHNNRGTESATFYWIDE